MAPRILDPTIMSKLAKKLRKSKLAAINVMVSKKAHKLGISAEAALILLAKEHGIGTSVYQRKLDATKQAEVRDALPIVASQAHQSVANTSRKKNGRRPIIGKRSALKATIEYLIQDPVLLDRCQDILLASSRLSQHNASSYHRQFFTKGGDADCRLH